ncbi:MAG TPA: hypothetical protein VIQ24_08540 [Pyrinomonadaceae bacterium]
MPGVRPRILREMMKHASHIFLGFVLTVAPVVLGAGVAAAESMQEHSIVRGDANACETNAVYLDALITMARESKERVLVIARLGKAETSRYLFPRRLHNARTYLRRLNPEQVLTAEGEQSEGQGRVEFYPGSRLIFVALVARGRDLCVNCCEAEMLGRLYYGWGKKDGRRRQKQLQYLTPQPDKGVRSTPS